VCIQSGSECQALNPGNLLFGRVGGGGGGGGGDDDQHSSTTSEQQSNSGGMVGFASGGLADSGGPQRRISNGRTVQVDSIKVRVESAYGSNA